MVKIPCYPLKRRLDDPNSQSRCFGEKNKTFTLSVTAFRLNRHRWQNKNHNYFSLAVYAK
jgi:hypothetical protein